MTTADEVPVYGVCSLGSGRWFWCVWRSRNAWYDAAYSDDVEACVAYGYAANKAAATRAAQPASGGSGDALAARFAAEFHRQLCVKRRAERSTARTEVGRLEFVYTRHDDYDSWPHRTTWTPHRVVKRTAKKVFIDRYTYRPERSLTGTWRDFDVRCETVDRAELEREGSARAGRSRGWGSTRYYLKPDGAEAPACLVALGLEPGCSEQDVRRAYRRLARKCHPDHGGDAEVFKALGRAYDDALILVGEPTASAAVV